MPATSTVLPRIAAEANHYLQVVLAGLASAVFDVTIFLMMLFFLLRDGDDIRDVFRGVSPLTRGQETEAMHHLTRTVKGVLQSMIIVPLAQGAVAWVGFWLLGVPSPTLWSAMVVFASLIPLVGSPLAWVPAAIYLTVAVSPTRGVLMFLYGTFVICDANTTIALHSVGDGTPSSQNPTQATAPWARGTMSIDCSTPFTVRVRWCIASVSCPRFRGETPRKTSRISSPSRSRKNSIIRKIVTSNTADASPARTTCR